MFIYNVHTNVFAHMISVARVAYSYCTIMYNHTKIQEVSFMFNVKTYTHRSAVYLQFLLLREFIFLAQERYICLRF